MGAADGGVGPARPVPREALVPSSCDSERVAYPDGHVLSAARSHTSRVPHSMVKRSPDDAAGPAATGSARGKRRTVVAVRPPPQHPTTVTASTATKSRPSRRSFTLVEAIRPSPRLPDNTVLCCTSSDSALPQGSPSDDAYVALPLRKPSLAPRGHRREARANRGLSRAQSIHREMRTPCFVAILLGSVRTTAQ